METNTSRAIREVLVEIDLTPDAAEAAPSTGLAELHVPDDRFIPVRCEDLIEAIESDPDHFGRVHDQIRQVAEALGRVIDQEVNAFRRALDERYAVLNPDRDTLPQCVEHGRHHAQGYGTFLRQLDYLLDKANFERLDKVQIDSAIATANSQGLRVRVRPERIEHLDLYVRGRAVMARRFKTLRRPIKGELRELDIYRRLAVVFQLKQSPHVLLKLFREIPMADIEALLPHAEVRMGLSDRLKLICGGAGALSGLLTKLFWALVGGAVVASQIMWVAIAALLGLSVKTLLGYRRSIHTRESQRTRHLYDRNLSNNAGVVHMLANLIAQEELKEAVLAYAFVFGADDAIRGESNLDRRIEAWLRRRFRVEVNFDCPDALETLDRLGLWNNRSRWRVAAPREAIDGLVNHWTHGRTVDYHLRMSAVHEPK